MKTFTPTYCATLENLKETLKQKTTGGRIVFCGDGKDATYMKYVDHIQPYEASIVLPIKDYP